MIYIAFIWLLGWMFTAGAMVEITITTSAFKFTKRPAVKVIMVISVTVLAVVSWPSLLGAALAERIFK